jgi:EAL domain-containing protein (putative c-di-GMP-specific phosphodiesterase class I)
VRAIIALGHSLDLKIVAEGVTSQAQLKFLQAEACDAVQGYLMSPAVPAGAFRDLWLRSGSGGQLRRDRLQPAQGGILHQVQHT